MTRNIRFKMGGVLVGLTLAVALFAAANVRADFTDTVFTEGYPVFSTGYTKLNVEGGDWMASKTLAVDDEHIYGFTVMWNWDAGVNGFDMANARVNGYALGDGLWSEFTELLEPEANTLYFVIDTDKFLGTMAANGSRIEFALLDVAGYPFGGSVQFTLWQYPPPDAVPEPATLLVLGLGLAGLPIVRRLRKG